MPEASVPESAKLPSDYEMKPPSKEVRLEFWELAKNRVRYVTLEEVLIIHTQIGKPEEFNNRKGAFAIVSKREEEVGFKDRLHSTVDMIKKRKSSRLILANIITPEQKKLIDSLEIYVNQQFFNINGEDYSDMIPYVIEHEIYEMWVRNKQGFTPSPRQAHLLADRHEVRVAIHDGKVERYREFLKVAYPESYAEAEEMYRASVKEGK